MGQRSRAPGFLAAFLLILVLHGAYVLWSGVRLSPDTQVYDYWAGRLIETGFDYGRLLGEVRSSYPAILYVLFATLAALLKWLFGPSWTLALVVLNWLAHAALGAMLARLAGRVAGPVAAWTALLFYLGSFDIVQWVPFVLSDTSFILLIFAVFAMAAGRILSGRGGWLAVFAAATAAIFYRPTGIVLLPDLAWAYYLARSKGTRIARTRIVGFLCAAALGGALIFALLVQYPPALPDGTLSFTLAETAKGFRIGEIVHHRPETFHAVPASLADHLLIIADRFLHFFAPAASTFGVGHALVQYLFFLPCYGLGLWFIWLLLRGRTALAPPARDVAFAALGAVFAYAFVHALLQVDFDWRYRLPVIPHMILLAAAGASELVRRLGPGPWRPE